MQAKNLMKDKLCTGNNLSNELNMSLNSCEGDIDIVDYVRRIPRTEEAAYDMLSGATGALFVESDVVQMVLICSVVCGHFRRMSDQEFGLFLKYELEEAWLCLL
ncbi:unnamed protein product [Arabis nemorensis]|uniref:Uncharacterized protein n=1 Tax=Arabis nemorensis TaxID=586526 RepID=A0A565C3Q3_9BRAS|nr:unnamed protein product [Arabis nemorensis]